MSGGHTGSRQGMQLGTKHFCGAQRKEYIENVAFTGLKATVTESV